MPSSQRLLIWTGAALLQIGCADYLTGQLAPPDGSLQLTKLTLFDSGSRKDPVFTDTSLPNCDSTENKQIDCSTVENRTSDLCRVCYLDVFKDMYSLSKSPPTPDSGQDMRVVFNKAPLSLAGTELANVYDPTVHKTTTDAGIMAMGAAVKLSCADCGAVPKICNSLVISGSGDTFDPTTVPYGPSIKMSVQQKNCDPSIDKPTDPQYVTPEPRTALEPDSHYTVTVDNRLASRDGQELALTVEKMALLNFKTEPFMALRFGRGDSMHDKYISAEDTPGLFTIADHPQDAAVVVKLNAPLYAAGLSAIKVVATVQGGMALPVKLGTNTNKAKKGMPCKQDGQRLLYVYPDPANAATWPVAEVNIRIPTGSIADVIQDGNFGQGKHRIDSELNITLKPLVQDPNKPAPTGYTKIADAVTASTCS